MLARLLSTISENHSPTIICHNIDDALATLETAQLDRLRVEPHVLIQDVAGVPTRQDTNHVIDANRQADSQLELNYKVLTQRWQRVPPQEHLVSDLLGHMANVASGLWPRWYGLDDLSTICHFSSTLQNEPGVHRLLQHLQTNAPAQLSGLSLTWLQAAAALCRRGQAPVLAHFPHDRQLAQLACAIEPSRLIILLAVDDLAPARFHLYGLARLLLWLRQATPIQIALLIPTELAEHDELESVLYGAVQLPGTPKPQPEQMEPDTSEDHRESIWPIQGQPHPFSPGEQWMAAQLAADPELVTLFHCNATVMTVRGSRYLVDLLWPDGRVVVEIDGYHVHSRRSTFCADRQRDYELLISGYLVLRLSHDEVMQGGALAVEKIRDVVRFRRENL